MPCFRNTVAGKLDTLQGTILDCKIKQGKGKMRLWKNFVRDWSVALIIHCIVITKVQFLIKEYFNMQVNIIIATSILEEGLDVQSCNLVIRFDPCPTVCSFIQSRGRARMQNSDYVLMVQR